MTTLRRGLPCLFAAVVFSQAACALPVRPDNLAQRDKRALGRVAVIAADYSPSYEFESLTTGKGDAAAKGAGSAALHCGELLKGGGNGVAALILLVCLPISAAAGAIHGAAIAASSQQVDAAKVRLQGAIAALSLQGQAAERTLRYGQEMGLELRGSEPRGLAAGDPEPVRREAGIGRGNDASSNRNGDAAADSAIEVGVAKIKALSTGEREQSVALHVEARVRVVGGRDGRLIDSLLVKHVSALRPLEAWLEGDGQAIRAALRTASAWIAEQAIDEILLVYHPATLPQEEAGGGPTERVPPYALRALQPPIRNKVYLDRMNYGHLERYLLDGLRPAFRWEAWPRGFDITRGEASGQARDVRYDFRLFNDDGVAYERWGLAAPEHTVEDVLEPCKTYRWTARARFTLDGAPRATEWTGAYYTMGGPVAPWWWRRGSGVPALYAVPASVTAFYPIVETPGVGGAACPDR